MKPLFASIPLLLAALPAGAQADDKAERDRIDAARAAAEARFAEQEVACRGRFAVNDCVDKAKGERNAVLNELSRREIALNDAERRRKAAERQKELDERAAEKRQQASADKRAKAQAEQKEREERNAQKNAKRLARQGEAVANPQSPRVPDGPAGPQGKPREPKSPATEAPTPSEAAQNRAGHEAKLKEAAQHKAEVLERAAKRKKAASDLPIPQ